MHQSTPGASFYLSARFCLGRAQSMDSGRGIFVRTNSSLAFVVEECVFVYFGHLRVGFVLICFTLSYIVHF